MRAPSSPPVEVSLEGGVDSALEQIPACAGVGQVLGENLCSLTIGRPANLRTWFGAQLGRAKPKKGKRPPTDLRPVARLLRLIPATSGFAQRLAFERLMAQHVPASARRDLPTPVYLHLDPEERFPRLRPHMGGAGRADLFGPFRSRKVAQRALSALHKIFPLRSCDERFEPAPDLPLGRACLYAQVRSCAAPCLQRIGEDEYRSVARDAAALLADPRRRSPEMAASIPVFVAAASAKALVAERGRAGVELYPVSAGSVDEDAALVAGEDLGAAVRAVRWDAPRSPGRDEAWLASWLQDRRRRGAYVIVAEAASPDALAAALASLC